MKRLILILSTLAIFGFSFSQNHQLSLGVGILSSNTATSLFTSLSTNLTGDVLNTSKLSNGQHFGEFRFSYAYSVLNWMSIGATYSFSKSTYDRIRESNIIGKQITKFHTVAGEATFYYLKRDHVRLYGLLGAGVTIMNRHDKIPEEDISLHRDLKYFNFQFSPIGAEVGGEKIGGFLELGVGYRGTASIGFFVRP